jgi:hypothetical protein
MAVGCALVSILPKGVSVRAPIGSSVRPTLEHRAPYSGDFHLGGGPMRKPDHDPRADELLGRLGRQTRAVLATLDELEAHLGGGVRGLSADELDTLGRRLASIASSGLRVMQHDVERELER